MHIRGQDSRTHQSVHVYDLNDEQEWALARQQNEAHRDFTPATFVEDAEFIWARLAEGYTQDQVAQMRRGARTR